MFQQLGNGVFRRRYESLDLNIGVVVGEDGVLIVDSRASHEQADELKSELLDLTDLPVRWLVNTHFHWDHTFGNSRFEDAEVWGHDRCRAVMIEQGDTMRENAKRWLPQENHEAIDEVEIVPPTHTFSEKASLAIGRAIELSFHGMGHTDSDIVVAVPDDDVCFMGDLIEEGAPPSFGDSYPRLWPLTLRLAAHDRTGIIVPGHGDIVDSVFVRNQHEELVAVAELATFFLAGEMSLEEATSKGPYSYHVMVSALTRAREVV